MPAPSHLACLLVVLTLPVAGNVLLGQETGGTGITASPGSLFSAEEIARASRIAADNRARRESYIQANEDDDVIVLEPYIVEGDDSLLMARLRREMQRRSAVLQPRHFGVPEIVLRDLERNRQFDDQFFHGPSAGAPRDAVPAVPWLSLARGIGKALVEKRAGDIFRAPDAPSNP